MLSCFEMSAASETLGPECNVEQLRDLGEGLHRDGINEQMFGGEEQKRKVVNFSVP
jgi:hypothetical protein